MDFRSRSRLALGRLTLSQLLSLVVLCAGASLVASCGPHSTSALPPLHGTTLLSPGGRTIKSVGGSTCEYTSNTPYALNANCYIAPGDSITVSDLWSVVTSASSETYPSWTCSSMNNPQLSYGSFQPVSGISVSGSIANRHGLDCHGFDASSFTISASSAIPSSFVTEVEMKGTYTGCMPGYCAAQAASTAWVQIKPVSQAPSPSATPPPTYNTAIYNAAVSQAGQSDPPFIQSGYSCREGCVMTVNGIVHQATGKWIGSQSMMNTDVVKRSGAVAAISQSQTLPGDFIIVDSPNHVDAHIGICLNAGCTAMNSNSSSHCTFTFSNQYFDYPGSPYHNGTRTFWRIK